MSSSDSDTGAMSTSLMDETSTHKTLGVKSIFNNKKALAAIGIGAFATGVLASMGLSSKSGNESMVNLQTQYTGTATLDSTNQSDVQQQNAAASSADVPNQRCNTNPYGQCPSA